MKKKLIILGDLNSKYLLSLFLAIGHIGYNIFMNYFPGGRQNIVLELYSTSLGDTFVTFIPYILKFSAEDKKNDKIKTIKKWLHYSILVLSYFLNISMKIILGWITKGNTQAKEINPLFEGPFLYIVVEMIFLTIVSIILLKYKYYIHHYISMAIFIIIGIICDLTLNYYNQMIENGFSVVLIEFLVVFSYGIYFYYIKYMMEVLYYPYWKICLCIGLSLLCLTTLILVFVLVDKDKSQSQSTLISDFYLYFQEVHPGLIIGKQIFIIISKFITFTLYMLNIYYFNPNFTLISFHLAKFTLNLIDLIKDEPEKLYNLIFFVIQFISLMFYLEIFEFNFCNLNKNTRRNIKLRGLLDVSGENGRDTMIIDINKYYYIGTSETENQKENNIELIPQIDANSDVNSTITTVKE